MYVSAVLLSVVDSRSRVEGVLPSVTKYDHKIWRTGVHRPHFYVVPYNKKRSSLQVNDTQMIVLYPGHKDN
jgi:hypothetical protein